MMEGRGGRARAGKQPAGCRTAASAQGPGRCLRAGTQTVHRGDLRERLPNGKAAQYTPGRGDQRIVTSERAEAGAAAGERGGSGTGVRFRRPADSGQGPARGSGSTGSCARGAGAQVPVLHVTTLNMQGNRIPRQSEEKERGKGKSPRRTAGTGQRALSSPQFCRFTAKDRVGWITRTSGILKDFVNEKGKI